MKGKLTLTAALMLALTLLSACALAATANASVVAPKTEKITAPFAGTLLPFDLTQNKAVAAGDTLFALDTSKVYAQSSGTLAALLVAVGDDASGACAHYGAAAVIEPAHPLYVNADTDDAYDTDDNRYLHAGEMLYLKCGDEKGTGRVTQVDGEDYIVEILTGDFDVDDTVRCFRESGMPSNSETGRGKVKRFADLPLQASGRVYAIHAAEGDAVAAGDLLFETIDPAGAKDASPVIVSPVSGAVTAVHAVSGAQVYKGQLLCEIADLSALELSAEVDELDLSRVRVGDTLSYTLDAYGDKTFTGTVTEIRPVAAVRQNAAYFDVRITAPADAAVYPGMSATVTIEE